MRRVGRRDHAHEHGPRLAGPGGPPLPCWQIGSRVVVVPAPTGAIDGSLRREPQGPAAPIVAAPAGRQKAAWAQAQGTNGQRTVALSGLSVLYGLPSPWLAPWATVCRPFQGLGRPHRSMMRLVRTLRGPATTPNGYRQLRCFAPRVRTGYLACRRAQARIQLLLTACPNADGASSCFPLTARSGSPASRAGRGARGGRGRRFPRPSCGRPRDLRVARWRGHLR